jgi:hypothetical protein
MLYSEFKTEVLKEANAVSLYQGSTRAGVLFLQNFNEILPEVPLEDIPGLHSTPVVAIDRTPFTLNSPASFSLATGQNVYRLLRFYENPNSVGDPPLIYEHKEVSEIENIGSHDAFKVGSGSNMVFWWQIGSTINFYPSALLSGKSAIAEIIAYLPALADGTELTSIISPRLESKLLKKTVQDLVRELF